MNRNRQRAAAHPAARPISFLGIEPIERSTCVNPLLGASTGLDSARAVKHNGHDEQVEHGQTSANRGVPDRRELHPCHGVMQNLNSKNIQVDEIWAFVGAKEKTASERKKHELGWGDAWTWIALDADSNWPRMKCPI
jgi:hypothetical protein